MALPAAADALAAANLWPIYAPKRCENVGWQLLGDFESGPGSLGEIMQFSRRQQFRVMGNTTVIGHMRSFFSLSASSSSNHKSLFLLKKFLDGLLAQLKSYKFVQSFAHAPIASTVAASVPRYTALKKRGRASSQPPQRERPEGRGVRAVFKAFFGHDAGHEYWQALLGTLSDLNITEDEVRQLEQKQRALGLGPEEIRSLHARAFADGF